ncbi:hypothetical protein [Nitrosopumilus sp.]|uniref:hypothetical protein n=1 Tax=Nitrosopumilus sp. TaxID=2024843 RepID=UPI00260FD5FA|nr:hypothetical protein [Nitrosopumilus sp.]
MGNNFGTVYDLAIDGNHAYYFEHDKSKSSVFLPDTRMMKFDGETISIFSEDLFMFPSELHVRGDFLYFVILSNSCEGSTTCDFQNIIKMSKNDGTFEIITSDFKSAVRLSLGNDALYASESSGNIWKINYENYSKEQFLTSENIILDISTNEENVFWIEEVEDLNNQIMKMPKTGSSPSVVKEDLQIAYDLTSIDDSVFWNNIRIQSKSDGVGDFNYVMKYDGEHTHTLFESLNTSILTQSQDASHYSAFLFAGDYIIMVNNTKTNPQPIIQMKHFTNDVSFDVATVSDSTPLYMKAESTSLYVIGHTQEGFSINHYLLPVSVPEFGFNALMLVSIPLLMMLFLVKFLPSARLDIINN